MQDEKPCPNCGYCPTCKKPTWPIGVMPYGIPSSPPYWEWPYRPIWVYTPEPYVPWTTTVTSVGTIKQS